MAYCGQKGKDRIIFMTKEDHEIPSNAELEADDPSDSYKEHGLILPNGDINWNCPCFAGMASGPCGEPFSAFSCFHYSTEDLKGSDCVDQFRAMQECMQKYPDLYPQDEEEEEEEEEKPAERLEKAAPPEATQPKKRRGQANEGAGSRPSTQSDMNLLQMPFGHSPRNTFPLWFHAL